MARQPRLLLPGYPLHLIIRGHNRQPVFVTDDGRQRWVDWMRDAARENEVSVHAWVLLDNHAHLLLTPADEQGLARMMQSLGRRYTQYFNAQQQRTGTVWEGRFKSSLVDVQHLLRCIALIELNPVRAGLVARAEDWRWSSCRHHVGLDKQPWLTEHAAFWSLGNTPFERQLAWRAQLDEGLPAADAQRIVDAVLHGWALGGPAFIERIERESGRRAAPRPRGRPRNTPEGTKTTRAAKPMPGRGA